jgi:hypothetical protein
MTSSQLLCGKSLSQPNNCLTLTHQKITPDIHQGTFFLVQGISRTYLKIT